MSDSEVDILLASNSLKDGEVHLQHILIALPDGANAAADPGCARPRPTTSRSRSTAAWISPPPRSATPARRTRCRAAIWAGAITTKCPKRSPTSSKACRPARSRRPCADRTASTSSSSSSARSNSKQVVTEYHARHILIKTGELASNEEAQKTVADMRHRIVDGKEDFATLAKKYSQDPTSAQAGGDLGWFQLDQYGPRVSAQLTSLKDNEISQPFQTEAGWHIIQRLGTREQRRTDTQARSGARRASASARPRTNTKTSCARCAANRTSTTALPAPSPASTPAPTATSNPP